MDALWQAISPASPSPIDYADLDFWDNPEKAGWLSKQGEYLKTWRRRWFVLKQGRLLWFKDPKDVKPNAKPRGVIHMNRCVVVRGAADVIHKEFSFVMYIDNWPCYLVADNEAVKEEWINSIGRVIVQNSGVVMNEVDVYDNLKRL